MGQGGSGQDVANAFVQGYVDLLDSIAAQPGGRAYRDLVAMSVVDGDAVATLDRAIESFSQAAVAHMPEITTAVARARADALEFVAGFPGLRGRVARPRRPRRLHAPPHRRPRRRRRRPGRGVRGPRPGGHPAGDRPGHPAGDRDQRLPAGEPAEREPGPCSATAPSRRAGRSSSRRSSQRGRLVPEAATATGSGSSRRRRRSSRPTRPASRSPRSSPTARAPTSPVRRPTSSPGSAGSSRRLG